MELVVVFGDCIQTTLRYASEGVACSKVVRAAAFSFEIVRDSDAIVDAVSVHDLRGRAGLVECVQSHLDELEDAMKQREASLAVELAGSVLLV